MKALVWNARGLGKTRAFHELRRLVADTSPNILFICETKTNGHYNARWKTIWGFEDCFVVNSCGRSGELMLFWRNSIQVSICSFSKGYIDCLIKSNTPTWRFTGFYGNPNKNLRNFFWELLSWLAKQHMGDNIEWIIGEDSMKFNSEKNK